MKFLAGLGKFVAFLLSIIFIFVLTGGIILTIGKSFMSKRNIEIIMKESNVIDMPISIGDNTVTVKEYVKDELGNSVDPVIIDEVLKTPEINDAFTKYYREYLDYLQNNNKTPSITDEDIDSILDSKALESKLSTEEKTTLETNLKTMKDDINDKARTTLDKINSESNVFVNEFNTIKKVLSFNITLTLIISIIGITILIGLCIWSVYNLLLWIGVPTIIAGILIVFIGLLKGVFMALFNISDTFEGFNTINNLFSKLFNNILITGIVIAVIGIILVVIYNIFKKGDKEEVTYE